MILEFLSLRGEMEDQPDAVLIVSSSNSLEINGGYGDWFAPSTAG
jgi:hypothetical protein